MLQLLMQPQVMQVMQVMHFLNALFVITHGTGNLFSSLVGIHTPVLNVLRHVTSVAMANECKMTDQNPWQYLLGVSWVIQGGGSARTKVAKRGKKVANVAK
jgi:hypothetical protein